ncbi:M24 family metallopeptidase [Pirellulaceae bacterium SH467]|jgi:Xaa-Pro aminopeptidase
MPIVKMMAGVPVLNAGLYRTAGFLVGDPVVWIELSDGELSERHFILRDIELDRARKHSRATHCWSPLDFAPKNGLSGDRETATAQSAAEFLKRRKLDTVIVDRSIPMIYVHMLREAGLEVQCDLDWGILERRQKTAEEIEKIYFAQQQTEKVMERACQTVARSVADRDGVLYHDGGPLTSERLQSLIDVWLLELGFSNPTSIVAGGPVGADCHDHGHGFLRTEEPVIVDIFPRDKKTLYNGDCTRTVVHGGVSETLARMHSAVVRAKGAATSAVRAGVTGQQVHEATIRSMEQDGYAMGLPPADAPDSYTAMTHGTGHGLGLEVHEPPLLAMGGPTLLVGDVVTIEPGLYSKAIGGVRVEDIVVVESDGYRSLNHLHEGLDWK